MTSFSEKVVIYGPALPMNLTPLWVAHDKGFFREEGLDVTLEAVLGIPDAQHPRHQWRKEGKVVFASPGGSPMFRSVREKRGPEDSDINVITGLETSKQHLAARAYSGVVRWPRLARACGPFARSRARISGRNHVG